ncbi:MAG: hypothetical protein MZU91_14455 [Desulfosudis oleivorans]|nr:hypothetical protein [Desulfosudis oleivorans]
MGITGVILTKFDSRHPRRRGAVDQGASPASPSSSSASSEKLDGLEAVPPRAHRLAHPGHGRRGEPGREGPEDHGRSGEAEALQDKLAERDLHPGGLPGAVPRGCARWAASSPSWR